VMFGPSGSEEVSELAIERQAPRNPDAAVFERVLRIAHEKADAVHHRLPQFYLRKFVGKSRKVEVLNPWTGSKELLAPKEAFAKQGYYTGLGEEMEPLALVEVLYETIEDGAAKPIRRLSKGGSPAELSGEERARVAAFLSTQLTRGESFKQTTDDFVDEMSKLVMKTKVAHDSESWADWAGEEGRELTPEQFEAAIDRDAFRVTPSAEHLLNLRLVSVEAMAEIFVDFSWHCVWFERPCLFTCEEPVIYWQEPSPATAFRGIGAGTTDEVRIALSPRLALVLVRPRWGFRDSMVAGGRREADLLNFGTAFFRPGFPIVRCPDVEHHPLPMDAFTGSLVAPPFTYGPIIRA
jgi:Protein of unknown function (DUF4238)